MANVGMKHIIFAIPQTPAEGETWAKPVVIAADESHMKARRAAITYNWAEGDDWGDDAIQEHYKILLDADIELEVTSDVYNDIIGQIGVEKWIWDDEENEVGHYALRTLTETEVGFGYIQCLVVNGARKFRAVYFPKVRFSRGSEESATKEDTIAFGGVALTGKAQPVYGDDGEAEVRYFHEFTTLEAAQGWLETYAAYGGSGVAFGLASLTLDELTLEPAYDPFERCYTVEIPEGETGNIAITATAAETGKSVWMLGTRNGAARPTVVELPDEIPAADLLFFSPYTVWAGESSSIGEDDIPYTITFR